MTLALAATGFSSTSTNPPRVELDVTSSTASPSPLTGSETLTVWRIDPDGKQRQVIIPSGSRLSGGIATLFDYHAPFNKQVSYVVTAGSANTNGTPTPAPAIIGQSTVWLIHPTNPKLSVEVFPASTTAVNPAYLDSIGSRVRPNKVGQFDIPGRKTPITINDGQRRSVQSSITIRTQGDVTGAALDALLDDGGPILLSTPGTEGWDVKWEWIQPLDLTFTNKTNGWVAYPFRDYALPYVVVDQPVANSGSLWTWGDIAGYPTWGAVAAAYSTWGKMAVDQRL